MSVTTIPISRETKKALETIKGDRTWDELIMELLRSYMRGRAQNALEELRGIPTDYNYEEVRLKLGLRR